MVDQKPRVDSASAKSESGVENRGQFEKNNALDKPPDVGGFRGASLDQLNAALDTNLDRHDGSAGGDGESLTLVAISPDGSEERLAYRGDGKKTGEQKEVLKAGVEVSEYPRKPGFADVSITVTDEQVEELAPLGLSKAHLEAIKAEIYMEARPIADTLGSAMEQNRVVAIGESHDSGNALRQMGPELIRKLKASGATHLAVEAAPGKPTNADPDPAYDAMLAEAKKQGLTIVPVDYDGKVPDGQSRDDFRNAWMAEQIQATLNENPNNKVVFWVGERHVASGSNIESAASILKRQNVSVCTVDGSRIDFWGSKPNDTLHRLTPEAKVDFCIPTSSNMLSKLQSDLEPLPSGPDYYGDCDLTINFRYPRDKP